MRLYLSSYRIGNSPEKLIEFSRQGFVAIVGNALDYVPEEARQKYRVEVYDPHSDFLALGLKTKDLDLRHYFGNPQGLQKALQGCGLVWAWEFPAVRWPVRAQ